MTAATPDRGHYFVFSRDFQAGRRLCGECRLNYDDGDHIEITTLEPFTKYVCPNDSGLGHSSTWTGAHLPELRTLRGHLCICGAEFVKEDSETWQLSWEMQSEPGSPWHPVSTIKSRHAAQQQHEGLLRLIDEGEAIRNVELVELRAVSR